MNERGKRIIAGGMVGICYLLVTEFLVFAMSGFTINMGMLAVLYFDAHTAFLAEGVDVIMKNAGLGSVRGMAMMAIASFVSGAMVAWPLSHWKRCPFALLLILVFLSQLLLSAMVWSLYLLVHGPLQVS